MCLRHIRVSSKPVVCEHRSKASDAALQMEGAVGTCAFIGLRTTDLHSSRQER